jgi:CRP-like cAMP-binding protein
MNESDRKAFDGNYLVYGLLDDAKAALAEIATIEDYAVSHVLMVENEKSSDLIVILRGTVGVYTGKEKIRDVGPGTVLGEVALVDDMPRSATAVAVTPISLARFESKALRRFMVENERAGFLMLANLARVLSFRLREATTQVEHLRGQARDPWEHCD